MKLLDIYKDMELDTVNYLQIKLIKEKCDLCDNEKEYIYWIRTYSKKFREIIETGEDDEEQIKHLLYK